MLGIVLLAITKFNFLRRTADYINPHGTAEEDVARALRLPSLLIGKRCVALRIICRSLRRAVLAAARLGQ
jgi:hypothetical protein